MEGAQVLQLFADFYGAMGRECPVHVYQDWVAVAYCPAHLPNARDHRLPGVIQGSGDAVVQLVATEPQFGKVSGALGLLHRSQGAGQGTGVDWYIVPDFATSSW